MTPAAFEQAKAHFLRGVQHFEARRFADAEREFAASVAIAPGRASSLTNLGVARLRLGRIAEAAADLRAALAIEPSNAEALGHLATAVAELGQPQEALALVNESLRLRPAVGAMWLLRAELLRERGDVQDAAQAYRQALAHGGDAQLVRFALAALEGDAPSAPPRRYVEQLFDTYAEGFDQHLTQALQYRGPELLVQGLARDRYRLAVDLGCGTGLAAPLLRPLCRRLEGVDLAAAMVERARTLGLYDAVTQADLAEHLAARTERADLLLAADVFIYVGELGAVFAGAAQALAPGGEFCFTVEAHDGAGPWTLRPSLRYAHAGGYIRMLAGQHGFSVRRMDRHPLRLDQGRPVEGLFTWLERPSHAA